MIALLFQGFLAFVVLFWLGGALRVLREQRSSPYRVRLSDPGPEGAVRVAVVIPMRNEEANVGPCLSAVLAQRLPGLRVVVLDDGSTDRTAEILASFKDDRLEVLQGGTGPLPAGWLGKPWACHRAGQHALGAGADWLLFVDADVRLAPGAVAAAVGYAERHGLALLSGLGTLELVGFWERVIQPAVTGLIMAVNPLDRVNEPARRKGRPLANGQFLLFRAEAWQAVGGHAAVRADVTDDVGMATAITRAGLPYHLVFMPELFRCRMYDSFGALWEGWTKNLYAGAERRWGLVVALAAFYGLFVFLPYTLLIGGAWTGPPWRAWGLATVASLHALRLAVDLSTGRNLIYGLTLPLGVALTLALFVNSALRASRGDATWKGRVLSAGEPPG